MHSISLIDVKTCCINYALSYSRALNFLFAFTNCSSSPKVAFLSVRLSISMPYSASGGKDFDRGATKS